MWGNEFLRHLESRDWFSVDERIAEMVAGRVILRKIEPLSWRLEVRVPGLGLLRWRLEESIRWIESLKGWLGEILFAGCNAGVVS